MIHLFLLEISIGLSGRFGLEIVKNSGLEVFRFDRAPAGDRDCLFFCSGGIRAKFSARLGPLVSTEIQLVFVRWN